MRNIKSPSTGVVLKSRELIDNTIVRKMIYGIAEEKKRTIEKDLEDSKPSANPTSESTSSNINQSNEDNDSIEDGISLMSIINEDSSPCASLPVNPPVSPVAGIEDSSPCSRLLVNTPVSPVVRGPKPRNEPKKKSRLKRSKNSNQRRNRA